MLIKFILGFLLLFMIYNLFKAMMIMLKNDPAQPNMSQYIGKRVMASAIIVVLIIIAIATGIIQPNPRPY